jgi:hypothetical protein
MLNLSTARASALCYPSRVSNFTDTIFEALMFWKIVLVLGILGVLLGFAVTAVSVALPIIEGPRVSWDEAAFGIIPGVIVLFLSFLVFLLGLIFVIKNRRKRAL